MLARSGSSQTASLLSGVALLSGVRSRYCWYVSNISALPLLQFASGRQG